MTFAEELRHAADRARFTRSDLALWLGRPGPTVRNWLLGATPRSGLVRIECDRRIRMLNEALGFFPVPYEVTERQRRDYIKRAFQDANRSNNGIPQRDPPNRRPRSLLRGGD